MGNTVHCLIFWCSWSDLTEPAKFLILHHLGTQGATQASCFHRFFSVFLTLEWERQKTSSAWAPLLFWHKDWRNTLLSRFKGWARAVRFAMLLFSPPTSALVLHRRTRKAAGQHHSFQQLSPHRAISIPDLPTETTAREVTGKWVYSSVTYRCR